MDVLALLTLKLVKTIKIENYKACANLQIVLLVKGSKFVKTMLFNSQCDVISPQQVIATLLYDEA